MAQDTCLDSLFYGADLSGEKGLGKDEEALFLLGRLSEALEGERGAMGWIYDEETDSDFFIVSRMDFGPEATLDLCMVAGDEPELSLVQEKEGISTTVYVGSSLSQAIAVAKSKVGADNFKVSPEDLCEEIRDTIANLAL